MNMKEVINVKKKFLLLSMLGFFLWDIFLNKIAIKNAASDVESYTLNNSVTFFWITIFGVSGIILMVYGIMKFMDKRKKNYIIGWLSFVILLMILSVPPVIIRLSSDMSNNELMFAKFCRGIFYLIFFLEILVFMMIELDINEYNKSKTWKAVTIILLPASIILLFMKSIGSFWYFVEQIFFIVLFLVLCDSQYIKRKIIVLLSGYKGSRRDLLK